MIERIDLLIPPAHRSGYGVLPYFTKQLGKALVRQGIRCRYLDSTPQLMQEILSDAPDYTLSFNGLLPDDSGRFLCDTIGIPHLAIIVDSPNNFFELAKSPLTIVTAVDKDFTAFFKRLGCKKTFFLPHAVEKDFLYEKETPRPYEVVFFGTCLDYLEREALWKERYPKGMQEVLHEALESTLADQTTSYVDAFNNAMNKRMQEHGDIDPKTFDYQELFDQLEFCVRGRDRIELIRAITEKEVHVFGVPSGSRGWDYYLDGAPKNIKFHGRVAYEEALAIMQQSQIILNSCPSIKQGCHERILAGTLAGAAVITSENPYVKDIFGDHMGYYRHGKYESINEVLLKPGNVQACREHVLKGHLWDHRAEKLLEYLHGT